MRVNWPLIEPVKRRAGAPYDRPSHFAGNTTQLIRQFILETFEAYIFISIRSNRAIQDRLESSQLYKQDCLGRLSWGTKRSGAIAHEKGLLRQAKFLSQFQSRSTSQSNHLGFQHTKRGISPSTSTTALPAVWYSPSTHRRSEINRKKQAVNWLLFDIHTSIDRS